MRKGGLQLQINSLEIMPKIKIEDGKLSHDHF